MLLKRMFLALIFSLLIGSSLFNSVFAQVGQVSNDQLKEMMAEDVVIIDIRTPEEWKQTGVVKGSHLITFFDKKGKYNIDQWTAELDKLVKKDQPFVLICRTGNRTGQVSKFLDKKLMYNNVNNHTKGITSWIRAGNEVVKADVK
jgi:rhodanese-related sulfurtransferase